MWYAEYEWSGVAMAVSSSADDVQPLPSADEVQLLPSAEERTHRKAVPPLVSGPMALPVDLRATRLIPNHMIDELTAFVATVLGCSPDDLPRLHELPDGLKCSQGQFRHDVFSKRWATRLRSDAPLRAQLSALTRKFVLRHGPLAFGESHAANGFIFQAEPSLRIHMPGVRPLGVPHKDADYFHQPGEVNLWVPLTRCHGSNSLFCESSPGAADYTAFNAGPGDVCRFWGHQCLHFTVRNDTSITRVSLDVRVVPRSLHCDDWASPKGRACFRLGGYYESCGGPEAEP